MTFENLIRIGNLKPHAADPAEIGRLLAAAKRSLRDADSPRLSADSRLDLAYKSILQSALIAALANGVRPSTSEPGHHQLLIQALPKTIGIAVDRVRELDAFRVARNQSDYRGMPVSETAARECVAEARRLLGDVQVWLRSTRPDLA